MITIPNKWLPPLLALLVLAVGPTQALAHAFPDHAEPRVGSAVERPPEAVRIWFDGDLEPAFSTIQVLAAGDTRVDKGDGTVSSADPTLLEVKLPPLAAGLYHVFWDVLARDGHRTKGDYTFAVNGTK